jgi:flagellar FliL protein
MRRDMLGAAACSTNQGTTVSAPAAATEEAKPAQPKKSKKLLIVIVLVLVLVGAAVGGWIFWSKHNAAAEDADGEEVAAAHAAAAKGPPTFLPLENMVVNLADPGGERMAQIGITIEMADAHSADKVKLYLPSIRSSILMLISQRTSAELLQREGKEQLARDILQEVSRPLGFVEDAHAAKAAKKAPTGKKKKDAEPVEANPVQGVLFSSFIVQ